MKTKNVMMTLVAMFFSATMISAQTPVQSKTTEPQKKECFDKAKQECKKATTDAKHECTQAKTACSKATTDAKQE